MIVDSASVDADVTLSADACVVGSGAGGAMAAKELAEGGMRVVVIEEGRYQKQGDFTQAEEEMYPRLYRKQGTKATADYTVVISQGRTLGGSTVASFCVCVRPPWQVLAHWRQRYDLSSISYESLYPDIVHVESTIGVHELLPEQMNRNARKLRAGSERLGYRGYLPRHNRRECLGCGFCALGCRYDRKGDALVRCLLPASQAGATIFTDCRAEEILAAAGSATGVVAKFVRSASGRARWLRVRAPLVVLAAGAIGSPQLWRRSRLPDPSGQVGRNLRLQPCAAVAALFAEEIRGWEGIPQGYVVDEFLRFDRGAGRGFLLMPLFGHPVAFASMLPGFGKRHRSLMGMYGRLAAAGCYLHDRTSGTVELADRGSPTVSYRLVDGDKQALLDGVRTLADIYFAAGAQQVILPYNEFVALRRPGAYRALVERGIRANDPLLFSFHPQGTLRMGADPGSSVVGGYGEAHAIRNLFVCDASIFPTSVAVPPQITIMAFARRTARHILGREGRGPAAGQDKVLVVKPRSP